ncbi:MAG: hypothetical protein WCB19_04595 [Thermoplasmata archaeon]
MVFLFKRFRKEKKGDEDAPAKEPSQPVAESAESPPADQATQPDAPAPEPEPTPSPPPPPLPTAASPATPVTPVAPPAECFLCGTPLEDHHCPKCQMTWVE